MVSRVSSRERPRPLVSESIIDAPSQRLYAIGVLVALQAYKIYDLFRLGTSSFIEGSKTSFLVKWILIDALYLQILPRFRIPWLSFQPTTTILQIVAFAAVNVLLVSITSLRVVTLGSIIFPYWKQKEYAIAEHKINPRSVLHNSSRILGQYTVQILPEGTAKLNPNNQHFCLPENDKSGFVEFAVQFNSTTPKSIVYSYRDFSSDIENEIEISGRSLKKLISTGMRNPKDARLQTIYIKANKHGLYKLKKVVDKSNLGVRVVRSEAVVVDCPSAVFASSKPSDRAHEKCVGDEDSIELDVFGVPPLKVAYKTWDGKRSYSHFIDSVVPKDYRLHPLMLSNNPQDIAFYKGLDVQYAHSSKVQIPITAPLETYGEWLYAIENVTDVFGNTYVFPSVEEFFAKYSTNEDQPDQLSSHTYKVLVHQRPEVKFRECSLENPANLFPGKEVSLSIATSYKFPDDLQVSLNRYDLGLDPQNLTVAPNSQNVFKLEPHSSFIKVKETGIYVLSGVSSKYCSGDVLVPNTCLVVTPPETKLHVGFEEISDQCAGSIGARADLEFEGTPPFKVAYRMIKDNKASRVQYVTTDRTRYQLNFTPKKSGKYRYVILGVEDANYGYKELAGAAYSKEQTVFPLADAAFEENMNGEMSSIVKSCCIGDTMKIPVSLVGSSPWKLEYEILRNNKRESIQVVESKSQRYIIETPALIHGSQYTITLVSVEDANGCKRALNTADTIIKVRRQRPTATFYSSDESYRLESVENSLLSIPLRLAGEKPWYIEYDHVSPDNKTTRNQAVFYDPNSHLNVNKAGTYSLVSVRDSSCPGSIQNSLQTYEVEWLPKPSLSMPSEPSWKSSNAYHYEQEPVCAGDSSAFDIELKGASPYLLEYEKSLVEENGKHHSKQRSEVSTMQSSILLKTETSLFGTYTYEFLRLSDALYDKVEARIVDESGLHRVIIHQKVNKLPVASFLDSNKLYTFCIHSDSNYSKEQQIGVKLNGKGPFILGFEIKNEMTGAVNKITVNEVFGPIYKFIFPKDQLTLGKHTVRLLHVQDANGCQSSIPKEDPFVTVSVAEKASMVPIESHEYFCVGDRLSYALQGVPPFEIDYEFNGNKKHAKSNQHIFTRIAEFPGLVTMKSISDQGSPCRAELDPPIQNQVYDIPTVRVSDGGEVIENIHEGDQAEISFHFTGIPPFSFTYCRRAIGRKGPGKILEMHTITGIYDYEYKVLSSTEGVYTVLSVQDKYCRYPRDSSPLST
ncbi:nucleoporin Pom152 [Schizosaccharomyces cryophilus OY26]|uniref:Nucleoporin Pom152 n=1 Tax=Schizosaccharomyces cryophilus (strain OY26 / ATCC MYA-4695 / CBS 11777 / NBRC 106824 / NRRL Y48691) TaxID=653667 RepID=S9XCQ3_SCHCR|nr:nucleoporin Pom152 [Schizosaccharomyces cryophilus OY26]EPY51636.1 nucleoporin Pom152 [Schizosaccharomyces cryophilus OY26]